MDTTVLRDNTDCLNFQNCPLDLPSGSDKLVGWVGNSPGRSSFSLISSCLLTTFLCTWVVIHPRIHGGWKARFLHKIALFIKTLIAPELIAIEAAQEWNQARKLVKDCARIEGVHLDLVQAFYIGMFGIQYRTARGSRVLWPNQFFWLLEQGLLKWKDREEWRLDSDDINDRSNADATAKLFALLQVAWFVVQSSIRGIHRLPLAPLESMTLGYIPLFVLSYVFWWVKSKDIETFSKIDLPPMSEEQSCAFQAMAVSNDFDDEHTGRQESPWSAWYLTPRVFEKEARDRRMSEAEKLLKQRTFLLELSETAVSRRAEAAAREASDDIVLSHWDPDLYRSKFWPLICVVAVSFPALHLISWNGTFPTVIESWLWRGCAIVSVVTALVFMHFERVVVIIREPWTYIKILPPGLYIASRVVMLVEAFIAFRAVNPAIYETYVGANNWLQLL